MCSTFKAYLAAHVLHLVGHTEPRVGAEMTSADLCQAILRVSDKVAAD